MRPSCHPITVWLNTLTQEEWPEIHEVKVEYCNESLVKGVIMSTILGIEALPGFSLTLLCR